MATSKQKAVPQNCSNCYSMRVVTGKKMKCCEDTPKMLGTSDAARWPTVVATGWCSRWSERTDG